MSPSRAGWSKLTSGRAACAPISISDTPIGHAIEASDYRHMHGEAVAIGMHAASRLSALEGRVPDEPR